MLILCFIAILLILLCSISNREYFDSGETITNNNNKLKPNRVNLSDLDNADNKSIQLLNKYMKSTEIRNACNKLYRYCGENLDNENITEEQRKYTDKRDCGKFNDYQLGICTQDVYDIIIKKIKDDRVIISNKKLASNALFREEDYFSTAL
jgi:hypothetical protein